MTVYDSAGCGKPIGQRVYEAGGGAATILENRSGPGRDPTDVSGPVENPRRARGRSAGTGSARSDYGTPGADRQGGSTRATGRGISNTARFAKNGSRLLSRRRSRAPRIPPGTGLLHRDAVGGAHAASHLQTTRIRVHREPAPRLHPRATTSTDASRRPPPLTARHGTCARQGRGRSDAHGSGREPGRSRDPQRVRRSVADNDALSTNAHNVKIITQNGVVTLRGPVNTAAEKATIVAAARSAPGVARVDDQLEVKATD